MFGGGGWWCVGGGAEGLVIFWSQKCIGGEGAVAAHREKSSISAVSTLMWAWGMSQKQMRDCRSPQQAGLDAAALLGTHIVLFLPTATQKQAINSCRVEGTGYNVNELIVKP